MSRQDYLIAENEVFPETGEDENLDYYEREALNYTYPSDRIDFNETESVSSYDSDLEDDEDIATESMTPVKLTIQKKLTPFVGYKDIMKESSETQDVYTSRTKIYDQIFKTVERNSLSFITLEEIDMFSRVINNQIWYDMHYFKDVEEKANLLLGSIGK